MAALSRPGVNGFLGTAEIIEDLALLGALDGKLVWGSMNRVGLQGASFEMDDRFGAYDAEGIEASHREMKGSIIAFSPRSDRESMAWALASGSRHWPGLRS